MQAYDYKRHTPLEHGMIRLFKLLPGRVSSELKGNLVARRLTGTTVEHYGNVSSFEAYDALSYTWGARDRPSETIQILVDSEEYSIAIHDSLGVALRYLRKDTPTYWWIDALCINQSSEAEKNVQLQLMPHIFGTADDVIVWLGPEEANSGAAFDFLSQSLFASNFDEFIKQPGRKDGFLGVVQLMKRPFLNEAKNCRVIQEIACARQAHLYCGDRRMLWHAFVDAIYQLAAQRIHLSRVFSPIFATDPTDIESFSSLSTLNFLHVVDSMLRKTVDGKITEHLMTLEALLTTTTQFQTSNPRDTVYALLYLAKDAEAITYEDWLARFRRHNFQPALDPDIGSENYKVESNSQASADYESDAPSAKRRKVEPAVGLVATTSLSKQPQVPNHWSVSRLGYALVRYLGLEGLGNSRAIMVDYKKSMLEICRDVMKFVINHSGSVDMLCRPWAPTGIDLPSWVCTQADSSHLPGLNGVYRRVNAEPLVGDPMWPVKPYRASSSTKASWFQLGSVRHRSLRDLYLKGFVIDQIQSKAPPAVAGIIPTAWAELGEWPSIDSVPPEAFWRTLVANRNAVGRRAPHFWGQMCADAFTRRLPGQGLDTSEAIRHDCPHAVRLFLERVQCVIWSRRLVRFDKTGTLGITAAGVKKGDLLCILKGCSVPVVLREFIDGQPSGRADPLGHFDLHRLTHEDKIEQSRVHYEFIGEAYVHGMMDGEAYTWIHSQDIVPSSFRLQ